MTSYNINVTGFDGPGTSTRNCSVEVTGIKIFFNITQVSEGQQATSERSVLFDIREPVKSFIGRDDELKDLHNKLQNESGRVVISQITTISGLGGIGKSELARKYAYDNKEYYDENVIWINAETQESIKNSFHRLATEELKISITFKKDGNEQERDIRSIVCDVYKYFQNTKSLFIFDNAEEFRSINQCLPSFYNLNSDDNKSHVLITSRNRKWAVEEIGEIKVIELGVLSPEKAAEFIRKALEDVMDNLHETEISPLAEKLQYFPLALSQATSYIKERKKSNLRNTNEFKISDYLETYEKNAGSLLDYKLDYIDDRYTKTTIITWKVTLESIEKKEYGQEALSVLKIMAYLAPDEVYIEQLFKKLVEDEEALWGAVELLNRYSMINVKKGVSNIHRLVQQVMRIWLHRQSEEETTLGKALELINLGSNDEINSIHIITIWEYASKYSNLIDNYYLYQKYGLYKQTLLHLLSKNGCYNAIKSILTYLEEKTLKKSFFYKIFSENSRKKFVIIINTQDTTGRTPLWYAIKPGNLSVVKYLVEKGAALKARDIDDQTPLHWAAENGHMDIVKYLVEKGADFKARDIDDQTPLHWAAANGHLNVVKYLIEKETNFNAPYNDGRTLLQLAAANVYLDVVKYLVEKGADFNATDNNGRTLLQLAAANGRLDVVKYLVEKGADFNATDNDGQTPLQLAAANVYLDVVKHLVAKGAHLIIPGIYGWILLYRAFVYDRLDAVEYYIVKGADFNATDNVGRTSLHRAAANGRLDVVKYCKIEKYYLVFMFIQFVFFVLRIRY